VCTDNDANEVLQSAEGSVTFQEKKGLDDLRFLNFSGEPSRMAETTLVVKFIDAVAGMDEISLRGLVNESSHFRKKNPSPVLAKHRTPPPLSTNLH
jgi:hypothetical protein